MNLKLISISSLSLLAGLVVSSPLVAQITPTSITTQVGDRTIGGALYKVKITNSTNIGANSGRIWSLYVPGELAEVRGILWRVPGSGQNTNPILDIPQSAEFKHYLALASIMGYAIMTNSSGDDIFGDQFLAINALADLAGMPGIKTAPIVPHGFSKGSGCSLYVVQTAPERVVTFMFNKGQSISGETLKDTELKIPGLNAKGDNEDSAKQLAQEGFFTRSRSNDALLAFIWEEATNHEIGKVYYDQAEPYLWLLDRVRNPNGKLPLNPVDINSGWLIDPDTRNSTMMDAYAYADYPATKNKLLANWVNSKDMAFTFTAFNTYENGIKRKFSLTPNNPESSSSTAPDLIDPVLKGSNLTYNFNVFTKYFNIADLSKVEFFDYSQKVGEVSANAIAPRLVVTTTVSTTGTTTVTTTFNSAPFTYSNLSVGIHSFFAVATTKTGGRYITKPTSVIVLPTTFDTDNDGLRDEWEMANLGNLSQGAHDNPAKDGIPNLMKFALGLDPNVNGTQSMPSPQLYTEGGEQFLSIMYTPNPKASSLNYTVEVTSDLNGTWLSGSGNTVTILSGTGVTVRDATPMGSGKRFIRLRVTAP